MDYPEGGTKLSSARFEPSPSPVPLPPPAGFFRRFFVREPLAKSLIVSGDHAGAAALSNMAAKGTPARGRWN